MFCGNFEFPIINLTEMEMVSNVKKWNIEDIMKLIWFCHNPILNLPCGICRPCQQKMQGGMEFLLDKNAQKRYHKMKKIEKLFGKIGTHIYEKMVRIK